MLLEIATGSEVNVVCSLYYVDASDNESEPLNLGRCGRSRS